MIDIAKPPLVLAITGSIAVGKSAIAQLFALRNIACFNADSAVHELYEDGAIFAKIIKEFRPSLVKLVKNKAAFKLAPGDSDLIKLIGEGKNLRRLLGQFIFQDKAALSKLEQILYPALAQKRAAFLQREAKLGHKLVVFDIPLLFEKGLEHIADKILLVTAPFAMQVSRALARPNMDYAKFMHILRQQMPDQEKAARADYVIHNDRDLAAAKLAVDKIIGELTAD